MCFCVRSISLSELRKSPKIRHWEVGPHQVIIALLLGLVLKHLYAINYYVSRNSGTIFIIMVLFTRIRRIDDMQQGQRMQAIDLVCRLQ
jgi:hypothetical protein